MATDPIPTLGTPAPGTLPKWDRNPIALWGFIAIGVGRILLSGASVLLRRRSRKK